MHHRCENRTDIYNRQRIVLKRQTCQRFLNRCHMMSPAMYSFSKRPSALIVTSLCYYTHSTCNKSIFLASQLKGRTCFIKRDDLIFHHGVNGNKSRKLYHFGSLNPFPRYVCSIGGIQSNSMLAISKITSQHFGSKFTYFTKAIPKFLKKNPSGNYAEALKLGTQVTLSSKEIVEVNSGNYEQLMSIRHTTASEHLHIPLINYLILEHTNRHKISMDQEEYGGERQYWIPQGGATAEAEQGLGLLAAEIEQFLASQVSLGRKRRCQIFVESGTGATALFLHRCLQGGNGGSSAEKTSKEWEVLVTAVSCVMPPADLQRSMKDLLSVQQTQEAMTSCSVPHVLGINNSEQVEDEAVPFGKPCRKHLDIWNYLKEQTGIVFDLLYAPKAFEQIFQHWGDDVFSPESDDDVLFIYLHCGGAEGNDSQLNRYKYLGITD